MTIRKLLVPTICATLTFMSTAISMDASPAAIGRSLAPRPQIANRRSNAAIMDLLRPALHYSRYLPMPGGIGGGGGNDNVGTYSLARGVLTICKLLCSASLNYTRISPDPIPFSTEGSGTFTTVNTSLEGRPSTETQPVSYEGKGTSELLGDVAWRFDLSRNVQNSTIVANNADGDFPATADLYVYITGTLAVDPDITYRSQVPVHLTNPNLNSYNPQVNERWSLAEDVPFENADNPGEIAFTLLSADATFN